MATPTTRARASRKSLENLTAEDVMKAPVVTVNADLALREAARVLSDERISGALVSDHRGAPVGVVSLFDIASCLAGLDRPQGEPGGFYRQSYPAFSNDEEEWEADAAEEENPLKETNVADIMAPEIIGVEANMPLPRVADLMHRRRIHRVFVMGQEGPLGVISTMDVLGAMARFGRRRS